MRDNGEIDGEFITAGKELARSIQRIDDDEAVREVGRRRCIGRLFSHYRHLRQNPGEALQDHRFGCLIGGSYGRLVGLQTPDHGGG